MSEKERFVFCMEYYIRIKKFNSAYEYVKKIIGLGKMSVRELHMSLITCSTLLTNHHKYWFYFTSAHNLLDPDTTDPIHTDIQRRFKNRMFNKVRNFANELSYLINNIEVAEKGFNVEIRIIELKTKIYHFIVEIEENNARLTAAHKCMHSYLNATMLLTERLKPNEGVRTAAVYKFLGFFSQIENSPLSICNEALTYYDKLRTKLHRQFKMEQLALEAQRANKANNNASSAPTAPTNAAPASQNL